MMLAERGARSQKPESGSWIPPSGFSSLEPHHFLRRPLLHRVSCVHDQARALCYGGVIERGVIGYYHHAVGLGAHGVGILSGEFLAVQADRGNEWIGVGDTGAAALQQENN